MKSPNIQTVNYRKLELKDNLTTQILTQYLLLNVEK